MSLVSSYAENVCAVYTTLFEGDHNIVGVVAYLALL
jgi:hypothetical protein